MLGPPADADKSRGLSVSWVVTQNPFNTEGLAARLVQGYSA